MLAIKARIYTGTKNVQKFLSNFAKKTQIFVNFVNHKQKANTHLTSN